MILGGELHPLTVIDLKTDLPSITAHLEPPQSTSFWPTWAPDV